ncbi:hypothetical protein DUNSADRAFT_5042 [Dunaliella salina]|uniref:Uncharacterized protein n=1 Tax=Dunaliella salina TaxID=3046 RepID=A0ABQ7HAC5_DUNSA|nr:hypothetical protein DUNSADRAFT_5042 [Dunaliella salina]|eukprot:KAF5843805.1 hypothetical protein DUNSADRAFT_5042 [Dunaliella salina]
MDKVKEDDLKPPSALNVNERVLQCFWELASQDEAARLRASQQLVADLLEDQKTHGKLQEGGSSGGSDHQQLPKHKQLEHALRRCSPIMTYSLRRLARGLGSSRAASRQGFASAMASLLSALEAQHSKEGKKAQANGQNDGCGVLGVGDAMVLLEHCLEAAGSGKGVSHHH